MRGRRRAGKIPHAQAANVRVLRQRSGWTQARLGELMGWRSNSTVCAAEGRRADRQRGFAPEEVRRLAGLFGLAPRQLITRSVNCDGTRPKASPAMRAERRGPRGQCHDAPLSVLP
jgi:hypothetical protein